MKRNQNDQPYQCSSMGQGKGLVLWLEAMVLTIVSKAVGCAELKVKVRGVILKPC